MLEQAAIRDWKLWWRLSGSPASLPLERFFSLRYKILVYLEASGCACVHLDGEGYTKFRFFKRLGWVGPWLYAPKDGVVQDDVDVHNHLSRWLAHAVFDGYDAEEVANVARRLCRLPGAPLQVKSWAGCLCAARRLPSITAHTFPAPWAPRWLQLWRDLGASHTVPPTLFLTAPPAALRSRGWFGFHIRTFRARLVLDGSDTYIQVGSQRYQCGPIHDGRQEIAEDRAACLWAATLLGHPEWTTGDAVADASILQQVAAACLSIADMEEQTAPLVAVRVAA